MGEDRLPPQVDALNQPVVTVLQSLRIVEIVPSVVVQHLFWITRGGSVVLHRSLIEVLLVIGELEQQGNGRRAPNEMDGIDVARDLSVLFQLTCRLALAEILASGMNSARVPFPQCPKSTAANGPFPF